MERRLNRLHELEDNAEAQALELEMCSRSMRHFFDNWVWTYDPRGALKGAPYVPFDCFPKQYDYLDWLEDRENLQEDGAVKKSRDVGFTWLCGGFAVHRWRFRDGYKSTFGSRKAEYVDKIGDPDCIFEKIRMLIRNLPSWMVPPLSPKQDKEMLLTCPINGNTIRGEAGDEMGRGGRSSIYFLDEFAHVERQDRVEAATSQNSDVRIFGSSANGTANLFYRKVSGGLASKQVFTLHYTDDPRWNADRVAKEKQDTEPHIWASEMEINFAASIEGVVIPGTWVDAAIDAIGKLRKRGVSIEVTGARRGALDVADEGMDTNAFCIGQGIEIQKLEQWSGKNSDIYATTERCFQICDVEDITSFRYDADGLGAGVRGDARIINQNRRQSRQPMIHLEAFRGSEGVDHPEREDVKGRKNIDYFENQKAQKWFRLRRMFHKTYLWVVEDQPCDLHEIISINPSCGNLTKAVSELSQPTFGVSKKGRLMIDKTPDGSRSPNIADAIMIWSQEVSLKALGGITEHMMTRARSLGKGRRR